MQSNHNHIDPFKFSEVLTPRMRKGYNFEKLVKRELEDLGFEWSWTIGLGCGEGVDFFHRDYQIEIEAKFSHAVIWPSWVKRDWLSRFSKDAKLKIVVCNRGIKLTNEGWGLLRENNIFVVYYDQLRKVVEDIVFWFMIPVTNYLNSSVLSTKDYCTYTYRLRTYDLGRYALGYTKSRLRDMLLPHNSTTCTEDMLDLSGHTVLCAYAREATLENRQAIKTKSATNFAVLFDNICE
jgi:hypothetical protein